MSSRLAVKLLFNSKFDFESTAPGKTDPTRLEVLQSTQVDLLGSTPRSRRGPHAMAHMAQWLIRPCIDMLQYNWIILHLCQKYFLSEFISLKVETLFPDTTRIF